MKIEDSREIEVTAVSPDGRGELRSDRVVVEEPLEIRVHGDALATTMRTPGHDRELVLGFLRAEGIIASHEDVSRIAHCGRPGEEGYGNVIDVALQSAVKFDPDRSAKRGTLMTSACGVCGRRTIDDLLAAFQPALPHPALAAGRISDAIASLRAHQPLFAQTGGCHAASLVRFDGTRVCTFEDVGRHNAVDKVVGARLVQRECSLGEHMLLVSGRTSFEIVQKAMAARIPVVASVSAASSLAVELAARAGITLVGFVRHGALTVYTGQKRVTLG